MRPAHDPRRWRPARDVPRRRAAGPARGRRCPVRGRRSPGRVDRDIPISLETERIHVVAHRRGRTGRRGVAGVATLLVPRESAADVTLAEVQATVETDPDDDLQVLPAEGPTRQAGGRAVPDADPRAEPRPVRAGRRLVHDHRLRPAQVPAGRSREEVGAGARGVERPGGRPVQNFYDLFRSIAAKPVKTLPPRLIAGKKAVGFVVRNPMEGAPGLPKWPEAEITVWVDPETKLPLRIETVTREDGVTSTRDHERHRLRPPAGSRPLRPDAPRGLQGRDVRRRRAAARAGRQGQGQGRRRRDGRHAPGRPRPGEVRHEGRRGDPAPGPARQDHQPEQGLRGPGILFPRVQHPHDDPARRDDDHVLHREVLGLPGPRLRRADGQGDQDGRRPRRHREGVRQAELGARGDDTRTCSAIGPPSPKRRRARWT